MAPARVQAHASAWPGRSQTASGRPSGTAGLESDRSSSCGCRHSVSQPDPAPSLSDTLCSANSKNNFVVYLILFLYVFNVSLFNTRHSRILLKCRVVGKTGRKPWRSPSYRIAAAAGELLLCWSWGSSGG